MSRVFFLLLVVSLTLNTIFGVIEKPTSHFFEYARKQGWHIPDSTTADYYSIDGNMDFLIRDVDPLGVGTIGCLDVVSLRDTIALVIWRADSNRMADSLRMPAFQKGKAMLSALLGDPPMSVDLHGYAESDWKHDSLKVNLSTMPRHLSASAMLVFTGRAQMGQPKSIKRFVLATLVSHAREMHAAGKSDSAIVNWFKSEQW